MNGESYSICGSHVIAECDSVTKMNKKSMFMNRKEAMSVEITNDLKILVKRSVQFNINQSNLPNDQSIKVIGVAVLIISLQLPQHTLLFSLHCARQIESPCP